MANLGGTFDATQHEPNTGAIEPLPTDWYNVIITESENKQTKAGDGAYLELTLKVLDGPHANRLAWDRLNLWNKNPVAVEIAQGTLSAICHATQQYQIQDSSVLHGIPLMARIVEKPPEGGYDAGNDVKGYAPTGAKESKNGQGVKLQSQFGGGSATPAAPSGASFPAAGAGDGPPPWVGAAAPAAPPTPTPGPTFVPPTPPVAPAAPPAQPPAQPPQAPPTAPAGPPPWAS